MVVGGPMTAPVVVLRGGLLAYPGTLLPPLGLLLRPSAPPPPHTPCTFRPLSDSNLIRDSLD